VDLTKLTGGGLSGDVQSSKLAGGSYEDKMNGAAPAAGEAAAGGAAAPAGGGITLEEVAKHTSKTDCWVVVSGDVLDVTSFLSQHPGGELAILTFAGKDATEEFNMIHPPDVIGKYAPDAVIGKVGAGGPAEAGAEAVAAPAAAPKKRKKGEPIADYQYWNHDGIGLVKGYFMGAWYLMESVLYEVCATIFTAQNIKITNDRVGLTRSAILLILFIVIHAVGNLHVFMGPNDFNGYGYFYVRLYWTGFGLPANIVEEYILLSALLHVFVGLKRTWDLKLTPSSSLKDFVVPASPLKNKFNLAFSGLMLLTFMTIHLFQFRFGDTSQFGDFMIRPPPYLINFQGISSLNLFWTDDTSIKEVGVRDIYKLEFQIFQNPLWCGFYIFSVLVFVFHASIGWAKAVQTVLGIPKLHQWRVNIIGYIIFVTLGAIYISFPAYCMSNPQYASLCANEQC
jgi:predicted heme/steroid binding protein